MALTGIDPLRLQMISIAVAIAMVHGPVSAQGVSGNQWQQQFELARQLADEGSLRDAQLIFEAAARAPDADSQTRAYGYFGRAFVMQQRFVGGDTVEAPIPVDSILAGYALAVLIDPQGIGSAAHNNAGTLLRAVGRHEAAAGEFVAAAMAGPHPDRATFFLNAAIELAARPAPSSGDSTMWAIRQAMRLAPRRPDVLSAYSSLLADRLTVRALLDSLAPWRTDTLRAEFAANAVSSVLGRSQPAVSESEAATALVAFAETLPVLQISPAVFDAKYRGRIEAMIQQHSTVAEGGRALLDAMSQRSDAKLRPPAGWQWWISGSPSSQASRAAWSGVLRWMGDWYFQQGRKQLAQQFYEAALGGNASLNDQWVDRRALVPLGMIYVEAGDRLSNAKLQQGVQEFTNMLFAGKGNAYARGDIEQIRDFHLALGTIYAAKGQWTSNGPDNAEYQIEHLRQATRRLGNETGRAENVPPELLTKLAVHYRKDGRTADADDVKDEIRTQFRRQGRSDVGEQVIRTIDAEALNPDALKPDPRKSSAREPALHGVVAAPPASQIKSTTVVFQQPVSQPSKVGSVAEVSPMSLEISGRVRSAAGAPLPGVDVEVILPQGRRMTARTAAGGNFKLAIPRNTDEILIRVVHMNERFVARVKPTSPIDIRLAPVLIKNPMSP